MGRRARGSRGSTTFSAGISRTATIKYYWKVRCRNPEKDDLLQEEQERGILRTVGCAVPKITRGHKFGSSRFGNGLILPAARVARGIFVCIVALLKLSSSQS